VGVVVCERGVLLGMGCYYSCLLELRRRLGTGTRETLGSVVTSPSPPCPELTSYQQSYIYFCLGYTNTASEMLVPIEVLREPFRQLLWALKGRGASETTGSNNTDTKLCNDRYASGVRL